MSLDRAYEQPNNNASLSARTVSLTDTYELNRPGVIVGALAGLTIATRLAEGLLKSEPIQGSETVASVQQNTQPPVVESVAIMGGGTILGAVAAGVAIIGYTAKFGK